MIYFAHLKCSILIAAKNLSNNCCTEIRVTPYTYVQFISSLTLGFRGYLTDVSEQSAVVIVMSSGTFPQLVELTCYPCLYAWPLWAECAVNLNESTNKNSDCRVCIGYYRDLITLRYRPSPPPQFNCNHCPATYNFFFTCSPGARSKSMACRTDLFEELSLPASAIKINLSNYVCT
jgi:hypothetical protein